MYVTIARLYFVKVIVASVIAYVTITSYQTTPITYDQISHKWLTVKIHTM